MHSSMVTILTIRSSLQASKDLFLYLVKEYIRNIPLTKILQVLTFRLLLFVKTGIESKLQLTFVELIENLNEN